MRAYGMDGWMPRRQWNRPNQFCPCCRTTGTCKAPESKRALKKRARQTIKHQIDEGLCEMAQATGDDRQRAEVSYNSIIENDILETYQYEMKQLPRCSCPWCGQLAEADCWSFMGEPACSLHSVEGVLMTASDACLRQIEQDMFDDLNEQFEQDTKKLQRFEDVVRMPK